MLCKENKYPPLICLDLATQECYCLCPAACIAQPVRHHSICNIFFLLILQNSCLPSLHWCFLQAFLLFRYLLFVWSIFWHPGPPFTAPSSGLLYSLCLRSLQSGLILLFSLFCIPLLIIANIVFVFLAATDDWSDIFIELSVEASNVLYGVVMCGLEPISVYLKLELIYFFLYMHLSYIYWQRIL